MVAGEGTILINPKEGSIREYLHSLQLMRSSKPSRLLPAHGPILQNAVQTLDQYIAHRHMRLDQIKNTLSNIPMREIDIARVLYKDLPERMLPIAAIQVLCGLIWLQEANVATQQNGQWRRI